MSWCPRFHVGGYRLYTSVQEAIQIGFLRPRVVCCRSTKRGYVSTDPTLGFRPGHTPEAFESNISTPGWNDLALSGIARSCQAKIQKDVLLRRPSDSQMRES